MGAQVRGGEVAPSHPATRLVSEKATGEAAWPDTYARLCRKMMEQSSPKAQDDGTQSSEGKYITGGHLFHEHSLGHCREDFDRVFHRRRPLRPRLLQG